MLSKNKFEKIIRILEFVAKICINLIIFFGIIFLLSMLFGVSNFELPARIQSIMFWGLIISLIILLAVAIVEFILKFKEARSS